MRRANRVSLCAGDTHVWLNGSATCSCGQKWQRNYRLHGSWGEGILVLAGQVGRLSVGRGLAWGLDVTISIYYWTIGIFRHKERKF